MMKFARMTTKQNLRRVLLAAVATLAILAAPVCAPLCAAGNCHFMAKSGISAAPCHDGGMGENSSERISDNMRTCSGRELPEATLLSARSNSLSEHAQHARAEACASPSAKQVPMFIPSVLDSPPALISDTGPARTPFSTTVIRN
jgi:hypothetical protein